MAKDEFKPILHRVLQSLSNLQMREIRRFQAEGFVFTIQVNNTRYKIFQVHFGRDGSVYVTLPYFDYKQGIVSIGTLSPFSKVSKVNLEQRGKVTSSSVKYSHHPTGDVRFSQTGKVKSEIKKIALPLTSTRGHLFSINAQGFAHYEIDSAEKDHVPTLKRTVLNFNFEQSQVSAVKIVAMWYDEKTLLNRSPNKFVGPISTAITADGKRKLSFFIGSPQGRVLSDHVLAVTCEAIELLDKQPAVLNFIGGFDMPTGIIAGLPTFLCANYPVEDFDEIAKRIGNIDLNNN